MTSVQIDPASPTPPTDTGNGAASDGPTALDLDVTQWIPESAGPLWELLQDYPALLLPVLLLVAWGLGKLLSWAVEATILRLTRRTANELDDAFAHAVARTLVPITVTVALMFGIAALPWSHSISTVIIRILASVLLVIVTAAAFRIVTTGLASLPQGSGLLDPRTRPLYDMAGKLLVLGAAFYLLLVFWGINPTAWLASAGIIGVAVGFAAKDSLSNLFAGVSIIADAPYKVGDYIQLDTGDRGMVTDVGIRSTRLLTRDDLAVTIPNSVIANAKIVNEAGGPTSQPRIRVNVGVAYGSDLEEVCRVLEDEASRHPEMLDQPPPRARVREFADFSVNLEIMGWIGDPADRGRISHELMIRIYQRFDADDIEIPFPVRRVMLEREAAPDATDSG